ncbi:MAG TPA: hypothetical protein VER55_05980 [Ardenticatenaceae bacterium]|nr:hypothetical protein [Ardenticatenaceae bacterium]
MKGDRRQLRWLIQRTMQEMGREMLRGAQIGPAAPVVQPSTGRTRTELEQFQESLEALDESDLAIYQSVLTGLEDTLMAPGPLHYRSVLDHLIQNIGSLLDDLGCFDLFAGELPAAALDFSWATTLRARVVLDAGLPLEHTRRRLRQTSLGRLFDGQILTLSIQRVYRPRLLRAPELDDWCYSLAGRDRIVPGDGTLLATRALHGTAPTTQAELPILALRTRLRDLLLGTISPREELIARLNPTDFVQILNGLLLDTRDYCYRRAHDERQREQLNRLLFRILARAGGSSSDNGGSVASANVT